MLIKRARRTRAVIGATAAVAVSSALVASPVAATTPPTGRYNCASGYYLKIKPGKQYRFTVAPGGKFVYYPKSHKIVFKTGYLHKDWYGKFRRDAKTGSPIIALLLKHGPGSDTCYK